MCQTVWEAFTLFNPPCSSRTWVYYLIYRRGNRAYRGLAICSSYAQVCQTPVPKLLIYTKPLPGLKLFKFHSTDLVIELPLTVLSHHDSESGPPSLQIRSTLPLGPTSDPNSRSTRGQRAQRHLRRSSDHGQYPPTHSLLQVIQLSSPP